MCGRSSATHNDRQSVFTSKSTSGPETNRASAGLVPGCPASFMRAEQPPPCCLRAVGAGNLQISGHHLAVPRACVHVWISLAQLAAPTSVAIGGNQLPQLINGGVHGDQPVGPLRAPARGLRVIPTSRRGPSSAPTRSVAHGATLSFVECWSGVLRLATITALMACMRFSA